METALFQLTSHKVLKWSGESRQAKTVDRLIMEMITLDDQPFSVVEDQGFSRIISKGFPQYSMKGRKYFSEYLMPKVIESLEVKMIELISTATDLSFTLDIWTNTNCCVSLLSQIWRDYRLSFSHLSDCLQNLTLNYKLIDRIWTPNVCFVNSKKAVIHNSPTKNIFLMVYPNGTVWVNYRLQVQGPCNMDLTLFPMDMQTCELIMESYAYNAVKVGLNWRTWNPVFSISQAKLADYSLYGLDWTKNKFTYAAGQWDQLT